MSVEAVATVQAAAVPAPDKKAQVERLLCDIFSLMELPATLDFKDATDGGLAVAVHFQVEVPGVQTGKKSALVDSIQFLVNKVVNRPNVEKRWVSLGVGGFPEPRPAQGPGPRPSGNGQVAAAVESAPPRKPARGAAAPAKASAPTPVPRASANRPSSPSAADEATMKVPVDADMQVLGKMLAEKAAKLGRHYAVMKATSEERAQLLQAAKGIAGVTVKSEGESYLRRLTFMAQKPTPMPKKTFAFPVDDDDDE